METLFIREGSSIERPIILFIIFIYKQNRRHIKKEKRSRSRSTERGERATSKKEKKRKKPKRTRTEQFCVEKSDGSVGTKTERWVTEPPVIGLAGSKFYRYKFDSSFIV
jgi:hypothetical protein